MTEQPTLWDILSRIETNNELAHDRLEQKIDDGNKAMMEQFGKINGRLRSVEIEQARSDTRFRWWAGSIGGSTIVTMIAQALGFDIKSLQ